MYSLCTLWRAYPDGQWTNNSWCGSLSQSGSAGSVGGGGAAPRDPGNSSAAAVKRSSAVVEAAIDDDGAEHTRARE